jgi:hypothetical protein
LEKLDPIPQDANALLGTCTKQAKTDASDGLSQDGIELLQSAIDDAVVKDTSQKKAMENVSSFADHQNKAMDNALGLI